MSAVDEKVLAAQVAVLVSACPDPVRLLTTDEGLAELTRMVGGVTPASPVLLRVVKREARRWGA